MSDLDQLLTASPVTRRAFLQGTSMAGFAAFLAACGTGTGSPTPVPHTKEITGPLKFANWIAYIDLTTDPGPDGQEGTDDDEYVLPSPTLEAFKAEYNVEVEYADGEIDDNETFMAGIRPQLERNVATGWDLIVLTDWMAAKVVAAGWAEELDPADIPTALANVKDQYKGLPWDPDFKYHMPWQSGGTGVGYNSESTGRDLTKIADLFDPAFAGRVTLLSDTRDTFPLIHMMLAAQGEASDNAPEEMTADDAQVVHDYLKPLVDSGHIQDFTGNSYLETFASGETWAGLVWSGDLASSGGENDVFVYPEEGANFFTDNCIIPKGAANWYTAEKMIDWVYDVDHAAQLANFIYYQSPVKGVETAILAIDPELEGNELLFPSAETTKRLHPQPTWDEDTERKINELYADLKGT